MPEGTEISSAAPEAIAFDGMTEDAIDKALDADAAERAGAPEPKPTASSAAPGPSPQGTPAAQALPEDKVSALEKRLEALAKESGQGRALQSRLDRMEALLKQSQQTAPQVNQANLPPEQQAAQQQLRAFLRQEFNSLIGEDEKLKALVEFGNQNMEQQQMVQQVTEYRQGLERLAQRFDVPFGNASDPTSLNAISSKIVSDLDAKVRAGDEAADAEMKFILAPGGYAYLFTLASREHDNVAKSQAVTFQENKTAEGARASQTVRSTQQANSQSKKSLADMSTHEISQLSETEIDAELDKAGVR